MSENKEIIEIVSQGIGNGPVLKHYYERMKLVETIDALVGNKGEGISCGEAVGALVAMVLNKGHALYAMEQWAAENQILRSIFAERMPKHYNDDQLGRCLDALWQAGLKSVHGAVSGAMVKGFGIEVGVVHHDTTSLSFYGAYEVSAEQTDTATENAVKPPHITYGYSRDKRPDLKQIIAALSVQQDGIPLLATTADGNQADGPNYPEHWIAISDMLGRSDFLYLGDTKLYNIENIREILHRGGQFLCPMPMSQKEQRQLAEAIELQELKFEDVEIGEKKYRLSEKVFEIIGKDNQPVSLRKIIVRSEALATTQLKSRTQRLAQTQEELKKLKIGQYQLKTPCAIERAVDEIIEQRRVKSYFQVTVVEKQELVKVKIGRGRPGPDAQYQERTVKKYELKIDLQDEALKRDAIMDGIYLLCCSVAQLSTQQVLQEYKGQHKVERGHRDLKGPLAIAPIFLHKPERVAALTLICVIALQLLRLMEFNARNQLQMLNEELADLLPNRLTTSRPSAVKMLEALNSINILEVITAQGSQFMLNKLSPLQAKLLQLLDIPLQAYSSYCSLGKFQNSG
jgi:transposase